MSDHKCHAEGCNVSVPPRLLMCAIHWSRLPYRLKMAILIEYRPGQEIDKQPSPKYLEVMREAIEAVR